MQRSHGFTLLEVLVAMVVISIGLIGLAGLMTTSLKNNQSASQRSQATWLAYDILDRMRANRTTAMAGSYNINLGTSPTGSTAAATDLTQWKTKLANALPQGDGSVAIASGVVTVQVRWNDSRGLGLASSGFQGQTGQILTFTSRL